MNAQSMCRTSCADQTRGLTVSRYRSEPGGLDHATRDSSVEGDCGVTAGRGAGFLAVCVLLLAACSSGNDAAPPTTIESVSTASSSSGEETTSLATSTTSIAPTTTATTTTVAPATSAPTTLDTGAAAEAAVRTAVERAIADFSECLVAMPHCDPAMLAATRTDPMLAINTQRISDWNSSGFTVIDRDQFRYVIESVEVSPDLRQATVMVCFADGSKVISPGAAPDGSDVIIDGTFVSGREAWDMRLGDDGVWRVREGPVVGKTERTDQCPAA